MLDLGTSFVASVARDPDALAIVDGDVRLTYAAMVPARFPPLVAAFDALGLKPGDHLVTVLQNRWEAATLHWACQFAGIVITPINWRAKADELDFCIENAEAQALVYRGRLGRGRRDRSAPRELPRIAVGRGTSRRDRLRTTGSRRARPTPTPRVGAEAWSVMLYTSGTTARPKGVPRRHRAERAAGDRPCGAESLSRAASARSA